MTSSLEELLAEEKKNCRSASEDTEELARLELKGVPWGHKRKNKYSGRNGHSAADESTSENKKKSSYKHRSHRVSLGKKFHPYFHSYHEIGS